jgi:gliding motility-associated-like protein
MKQLQPLFCVIVNILLFLSTALLSRLDAKHIIGGEVTYICVGQSPVDSTSNSYIITMKIYRDCDPTTGGAYFDNPAQFSIYIGSYTVNELYEVRSEYPLSITEIIPDTPKCIKNVPYVCVEEGIYTFNVDLPKSLTQNYYIVYQRCCRNNSIVNIYNPEDIGATYYVEITPDAQGSCNATPTYNDFPPIIICKDVPLIFDHSATDDDGDQLVYHFCTPENGGGPNLGATDCFGVVPSPPCAPPFTAVPFIQPQYSPGNPMGGDPQIVINPVTGIISGTPTKVGRFVVGVCVDEYRNGVKLSTVKRDFQFNVADCDPTVLAKIDGGDTLIYTPEGYYLNSCGGKELYIENKSIDISYIDHFEWRFDLLGAPYLNDSDWSPTILFPESGRYYGKLYLNPGSGVCSDTANITVDIFPEVNAEFSFQYDTCVAGAVEFTDLTTGEGGVNQWDWQFGIPGGKSTLQNPAFDYGIPGNFPVRLRATDQNGCTDAKIHVVSYFPAPPYVIIQPNVYKGCAPYNILFTNLSTPVDETYTVAWDFGDGTGVPDVISPDHTYDKPGVYDVTVSITSPIGCTVSDSFPALISLYAPPVADFTYSPEAVDNFAPLVQFSDQSVDAERWFWQFDQYATSNTQNPSFSFPDTGLMRVSLLVTHELGCKDTIVKYIDAVPNIRWFMPNAFTPNGDSNNDGFLGKGVMDGSTDFVMTIWNRWGELVFETHDPNEPWNGRAQQNGGLSPGGVYIYRVTFTAPRGEKFDYKGFATLVR